MLQWRILGHLLESSWAPKAEELEGAGGGAKAMAGDVCVRRVV